MSKYYVRFDNGNQCKNNAEKAADEYVRTLDGILLLDEASRTSFIKEVHENVEKINSIHKRCKDVRVGVWDYDGGSSTGISIAEGICYLRIYKVKIER